MSSPDDGAIYAAVNRFRWSYEVSVYDDKDRRIDNLWAFGKDKERHHQIPSDWVTLGPAQEASFMVEAFDGYDLLRLTPGRYTVVVSQTLDEKHDRFLKERRK